MTEACQSPDELSDEAVSIILSAAQAYIASASAVGLNLDISAAIMQAVNAATEAVKKTEFRRRRLLAVVNSTAFNNNTTVVSQSQSALQQYAAFIASNMVLGQNPVTLIYSQFRTHIQTIDTSTPSNVSIASPQSALEDLTEAVQSSIQVAVSNTNAS
eukprot:gene47499-biopygen34899